MRPSASTAARMVDWRLVAEVRPPRCSRRSSTHFTGAPALRDARHISTAYWNTACLTPKLPPESRKVRWRSLWPGTRSASAITVCSENGPMKFEATS